MKLLSSLYTCFLRSVRFLVDFSTAFVFSRLYGITKDLPALTNPILLLPASVVAEKIRKKQVKSVEVVEAYIARIQEVQPLINAVVDERFEEALKEARVADELIDVLSEEELRRSRPFLGVPFSCKEPIAVKGLSHTNGLYSRKGTKAEEDAEVVKRLGKAGAIPLVVSNVCLLSMWWDTGNYIYGTTNNPYDTARTCGGSTGGEGALIASAGSVIGMGGDLGGSIRIPSFMNGIFGHYPTPGAVPNKGYHDLPKHHELMNGLGPMCRYAADLLPMMKVMSANDARLSLDEPVDLKRLKIYYSEDDGGNPLVTPVRHEIKSALRKVLRHFEDKYSVQPQLVRFEGLKSSFVIWLHNACIPGGPTMGEGLADGKGRVSLLREFIRWCFRSSKITLAALFVGLLEWNLPGKDSEARNTSLKAFLELQAQFSNILDENSVFLYPTHPEPAPYHHETISKTLNAGYTAIFNVLGQPTTQCPLGLCEGNPIGIQASARPFNDRLTIAVARELEKAFGGWTCPGPIM